jgi:hypothetical protein
MVEKRAAFRAGPIEVYPEGLDGNNSLEPRGILDPLGSWIFGTFAFSSG